MLSVCFQATPRLCQVNLGSWCSAGPTLSLLTAQILYQKQPRRLEQHGCASRLQATCLLAKPAHVQSWPAMQPHVPQGCKPCVSKHCRCTLEPASLLQKLWRQLSYDQSLLCAKKFANKQCGCNHMSLCTQACLLLELLAVIGSLLCQTLESALGLAAQNGQAWRKQVVHGHQTDFCPKIDHLFL